MKGEYNKKFLSRDKIWDGDIKFNFRHRDEFGIHDANISLNKVYKFGINYRPIPKIKGKGIGHIASVRGYGYIITKEYNYYREIYYKSINDLRKLVRLYGRYRIIRNIPITFHYYDGSKRDRRDKEYIAKFERYKSFKCINAKKTRRKKKKL